MDVVLSSEVLEAFRQVVESNSRLVSAIESLVRPAAVPAAPVAKPEPAPAPEPAPKQSDEMPLEELKKLALEQFAACVREDRAKATNALRAVNAKRFSEIADRDGLTKLLQLLEA